MVIGLFTRSTEVSAPEYRRVPPVQGKATFPAAVSTWGVVRRYGIFLRDGDAEPSEMHDLRPMMVLDGERVTLDLTTATLHAAEVSPQTITVSGGQAARIRVKG
jgi:hypothetical protein